MPGVLAMTGLPSFIEDSRRLPTIAPAPDFRLAAPFPLVLMIMLAPGQRGTVRRPIPTKIYAGRPNVS